MSYPKPKPKSSVKAAFGAVRDFIGGSHEESEAAAENDPPVENEKPAESEANLADSENSVTTEASHSSENSVEAAAPAKTQITDEPDQNEKRDAVSEKRQRLASTTEFDQAVKSLRAGKTAESRSAAARTLAKAGGKRATPHLIAALFDADQSVRTTANELLAELGNSSLSSEAVAEAPPKPVPVKPAVTQPQQPAQQPAEAAKTKQEEQLVSKPAVTQAPDASAPTASTKEPQQLLVEENEIRAKVRELEEQIRATVDARKQAEKQIRQHINAEAKLRTEAAARREEEERLRKQAALEAEQRQMEDAKAIGIQLKARISAEQENQRLADEEARLRTDASRRRQAADQLVHDRMRIETARAEAAEASQLLEAKRVRQEAAEEHQAELERLRRDEETLRAAFEKVAHRRAEVETSRAKAEKEAELLVEAQARMKAAEEARAQAETERLKLESEINERLANERRQLEDTRRRGIEEQERIQDEVRRVAQEGEARLKEVSEMRQKAEADANKRAEKEQQLLSQIESLRITDSETRKRIEDLEARKHTLEENYKLAADKLQRIEAEAHARTLEEEQMLARLESTRRTVAVEAQARAEQEKRIKEEIEMFHRLEEEERPRLEAAILQRSQAESRFRELREQYELEQQALASAPPLTENIPPSVTPAREIRPEPSPVLFEPTAEVELTPVTESQQETHTGIPAAISAYLASIDPYKRAAAVAELARSSSSDAFNLIANAFDDSSPHVRNAAARALRRLEPARTVDLFNRALEEGSAERRQNIGSAIAASGVAAEAIENLVSESREETYNSLSILFVMAKTGEVEPLVKAIEEHENDEVRRAVVKLLNLSGQAEIADAALQRRVLGVSAVRQNGPAKEADPDEVLLGAAELEVKRAVRKNNGVHNNQQPT